MRLRFRFEIALQLRQKSFEVRPQLPDAGKRHLRPSPSLQEKHNTSISFFPSLKKLQFSTYQRPSCNSGVGGARGIAKREAAAIIEGDTQLRT